MFAAISSNVWLPIITLVLGFGFSLLAEESRDRRQSRREREARAADRDAEREARTELAAERRREFQRTTLLELQEAMMDVGRIYGEMHHHDVMASRKAGKWTRTLLGEELNRRGLAAERMTTTLVVRVEDGTVRRLVRQMRDAGVGQTFATSEDESDKLLVESMTAFNEANDRIGELLRELL